MANGKLNFSEAQTEQLFRDVHSGKIHLFKLPLNYYTATAEELSEAVFKGEDQSIAEEEALRTVQNIQVADTESMRLLKQSVYQFAAAKSFQFISDMQNFLFDERGFIRPFSKFKQFANVINENYSKNWLEAEYITSINMAKSATDWERIASEKHLFPFLKYQTVKDARVRPEHKALDGIVKAVDDPFWAEFMPPNGWRCRCITVQLEKGTETPNKKIKAPPLDPVFSGNAGARSSVFKRSHPYYKVPPKFAKHKKNNFGLPLPADVTRPIKTPKTNVPTNYIDVVGKGVRMSPTFWAMLPRAVPLKKLTGKKISNYNIVNKDVSVNMTRYAEPETRKLIVAHEFGHAAHIENGWMKWSMKNNRLNHVIVPEVETVFTKWQKKFGQGLRGERRAAGTALFTEKATQANFLEIKKRLKLSDEMANESWGNMQDTIEALTIGRMGRGHGKTYMRRGNGGGARMEFIAHAFEAKFASSVYIQELFPELFEDMKKMIDELSKLK